MEWAVAVLGTGGASKFAWDLVTARSSSKKTKVDGAAVLVDSATGYADKLAERLDKINTEFDKYRKAQDAKWENQRRRDSERDRRERTQDRLNRTHSRWDDQAVRELANHGIELSAPPPLYIETGDPS
jgi:hypothetical protein